MGHESNMGGTPLKIQAVLPSYDSEHPFIFMRHDNYWGTDGPDIPLEIARKMYDDPRGHEHVRVNGYAGGVAPEEWSDYFDADGKHLLPFALEKTALELIATGGPANIQRANEIRKGRRYVEDPAKEAVKAVMPYGYHIDTPEALVYFVSALREYGLVEPVARNSETLGTNTSGLALQASELLPNVRYALHLEGDKSVSTDENGNPFIVEAYTDAYSWELLLKQTLIDRPDVSAARLYWPQEFSAEARFMPLGAIETSGKGLAKKLDSETEYVVISNKQTRANFLVPKISR
jgi:hypothetical protein